jgi:hypothetical protein
MFYLQQRQGDNWFKNDPDYDPFFLDGGIHINEKTGEKIF